MKNFLLSFVLSLGFAFILGNSLMAQVPPCVVDMGLPGTAFLLYPDPLPSGCVGVPYDTVIQVVFPKDTTVVVPIFGAITVPFDSFVVTQIAMIPAGLNYQCNVPSCTYVPSGPGLPARGCVSIYGTPTTPTAAGDSIEITGQAWITLLGSPQPFNDVFKLALPVFAMGNGPCIVGIDNDVKRGFDFGIYPNPINSSSKISFSLSENADIKLSVYDTYGRLVRLVAEEKVSAGRHEYAVSDENLASGIYFVRFSVNNGQHEVVKKIVR